MAETLTFDNTQEATTAENLTSEEQDSLAVGERMQAEQEQLLAGKYKNAEDLEKAYVELQKKLGEKGTETSEETSEPSNTQEGETEEKKKTEENPATAVLDKVFNEAKSSKQLSEETINELKSTKPADILKEYLSYRSKTESNNLSEQDVAGLKDLAGGESGYNDMIKWASDNLSEQEVNMFDAAMESGNKITTYFAVKSLAYRYNDAKGVEGKLLTGSAPKQNADQFRSQAEVVQAMSDPRYDRDPAYRNDVMKKLERSDVKF